MDRTIRARLIQIFSELQRYSAAFDKLYTKNEEIINKINHIKIDDDYDYIVKEHIVKDINKYIDDNDHKLFLYTFDEFNKFIDNMGKVSDHPKDALGSLVKFDMYKKKMENHMNKLARQYREADDIDTKLDKDVSVFTKTLHLSAVKKVTVFINKQHDYADKIFKLIKATLKLLENTAKEM